MWTMAKAYFVACPDCADRNGPYICEGEITRADQNGRITIRNQVGGSFFPASMTPDQAVIDHAERHRRDVERAKAAVAKTEEVAARAGSLSVGKLRTLYDITQAVKP